MAPEYQTFEEAVLQLVNSAIVQESTHLRACGVTKETVSIHRSGDFGRAYDSEVEVKFWIDNNLVDILEFFVYRRGVPDASLAEIGEWFFKKMRQIEAPLS